MGAAVYVVLDTDEPTFDPFINGQALSREEEVLSALAAEHGAKGPLDFFDVGADEMDELAEEFGFEAPVPETGQERWFSAREGLDWVTQMKALVPQSPDRFGDAAALTADLGELELVLKKAQAAGYRWRMAVDY